MTPVSRHKLDPRIEEEIIRVFINELAKTTDKNKFESLITFLLSQSEKIMLAKRLTAYVMIDQGFLDSEIAKTLHLTRITVAKQRLNYQLSKERKEQVVKLIQKPSLLEILDFLLKPSKKRKPRSSRSVY